MNPDSLAGVWSGTAHNSNDWDMEVTILIAEPVQIGSPLGTYSIPEIPCSGTFRVTEINGETLFLKAEDQQGDCGEAESDSLEVLPDGTIVYVSKGKGWETRGILQRASG